MNKHPKRIAAMFAVIIAAAIVYVTPALAQNIGKTIDVVYRDIKIYIDGNLIVPQDATGKIVEPFIYNGTTYLPLRAVGEALGKPVQWDGASNSVFIGETLSQEVTDITVGSAQELVAALGSNRRILLKEGVYNLTAVDPAVINDTSVSYQEIYDGPELLLDGIHNLTIQGAADNKSEIVIDPRYAFVMNFKNCSDINISDVKAGHTEGGYCLGGVFSFENSSGIQIDDAQMYGCGTIGLNLLRATDIKVTNSSIYDCSYGIMTVDYSANVSFDNCVFRDNRGFTMVIVGHTSGFSVENCQFLRNEADYTDDPMFSISQSENVSVKNTEFADNRAYKLIGEDDITFDASNTFENNSFDNAG